MVVPQADSSTGAGQIGNERLSANPQSEQEMALASIRNQANINDVMNGDGNLREQMTMLFNGMFINGGKIQLESTPGVGTAITVTFPRGERGAGNILH